MDYFKILEIKPGSSQDEIKKAYRRLAHLYHPDKPTGNAEKFKEINAAYRYLIENPVTKKEYGYDDIFRRQQQSPFHKWYSPSPPPVQNQTVELLVTIIKNLSDTEKLQLIVKLKLEGIL